MPRSLSKARFFDHVARRGLWAGFTPPDRPKLRRLLRCLELRPGMTVLEPGCGTGRLTVELARAVGATGRVLANDISPEMLRRARARRLGRPVRWLPGPAEALRLPPVSVDRIVCFQSFPHFDDKSVVLERFRCMLRPGGLLAIVHFASRRRINRIHSEAESPVARDLIPPAREMRRLLRDAGFRVESLVSARDSYWLLARVTSPRPRAPKTTPVAPRRP